MGERVVDRDDDVDPAFDALLRRAARLSPVPLGDPGRLRSGITLCQGRIEVGRMIGEGGMGVVYEAVDHARHGPVAVKTLSRLDPTGIYRLKEEFRALAGLMHPNLVRLYDLFADEGRWFFTMELVQGVAFDRWVRPHDRVDLARFREAARQLLAGTSAIHAAGKLHRDLKPSNVLVTDEGRVVILDFGLATDRGPAGERATDDGALAGTPAYISPEQVCFESPTPGSDWYAVGVMLFEGLTGRLPFDGPSHAILSRKRSEDAPAPSAWVEGVPIELDRACRALLARDPAQRPGAAELAGLFGADPGGPVVSEAADARAHGATEVIGRDREFGVLREAFAEAESGLATVVRITGESGMGKTVLVASFLERLRAEQRAVVLSGRCYEQESVPFKAFDRVIDALTRHLRRLPALEAAALMPRDVQALARVFPVLARVEVVARMPARADADDSQLRRRAFAAMCELLSRMRDRGPVVLHVDDLHWSDHDSMLLLEHLLSDPAGPPLLFLLSHRERAASESSLFAPLARAARVNRRLAARELVIAPLSPTHASVLARQLIADAGGRDSDGLSEAIAAEGAGSPFFIGELSRHVARLGAERPPRDVSLHDALSGRLATLGPTARRALDLLAVSGRPVPEDVLLRAVGTGEHHSRDDLDLLRSMRLARADHERACECYHDRIRVAAVSELGEEAQRALHADLARAWSERGDADAEVLFAHCLGAGMREAAGAHAVEAAKKAIHALAFARGADFYRHALDLLPDDDIVRLELRERRAEALSLAGRWSEAADAFAASAKHAKGGRRKSYLSHWAAHHYLGSGRSVEGLPWLRENFDRMRIAWPRTRRGALLHSLARLAWLWLSGARYRLASGGGLAPHFDGLGHRDERFYPDDGARPGETVVLEMLMAGAVLVPPYDLARGLYYLTAFAARALRVGDPERVPVALGMLSSLFTSWSPTAAFGRRLGDSAVAIVHARGPSHLGAVALAFAAFGRLRRGHPEEALALALDAEARLQDVKSAHAYTVWTARSVQCIALLALGRVGEAARLSALSGREARERGDEMAALGGELVFGHLVDDDLEAAEELVRHKEAVLERIGREGALHQVVLVERALCALYAGRGGETARSFPNRKIASSAPSDVRALGAQCALQAMEAGDRDPAHRATVQAAIRSLRRDHAPGSRALASQQTAALALADGDVAGAVGQLEIARETYAQAGMALHEAIVQWQCGRLRADAEGRAEARDAERSIRDRGIANPEAWARMLAPGFGRPG